jgi:carbon monoxide dehydrogenase subunit G
MRAHQGHTGKRNRLPSLEICLLLGSLIFLAGCVGLTGLTIDPPTVTSISSNAATITWSTNVGTTSLFQYGTSVAYGIQIASNVFLTRHSQALTGLTANHVYHFRVQATDAGKGLATSPDLTFTTSSGSDTTPPTVSISSPANGANVSGTVLVSASASDNVGVASVQFQLDDANVGSLLTGSAYSYSWNTTTAANGSHTLRAIAKDAAGNTTTSATDSVTVNNAAPPTPPTISITAPASGAIVSGTVTVTTSVSANSTSVQFKLDGNNTGAAVTSTPFSYALNTTTLSNASHSITAVASNAAGQTTTSAADSITVNNTAPPTPPTISITAPASGATVAGTVTATTSVSSNTTSVQFKVDGSNTGAAVTSAPFSYSLNTTTLSNASHSITAVASNAAGQTATSAADSITVNNAAPPTPPTISITAPASGATVSGTVTVTTTVSANTTSVQFKVDGSNTGAAVTSAPFSYSLNTTTLSNASHSITAVASNAAGQTTTSAAVSVTVNNAVPPTISITAPASGATVAGTVTVTTTVSANTTSVQFKVDGNNTGAAVSSAPFSYALNTTTLSNASHSITAVASNAAGQTTTSAGDSITVNNTAPPTPPTISITGPASGATVSGTVTVTTSVSANTTSVQFKVDGNNTGAAVTSAPFSYSLNTTTLNNASHSITTVASNAAGQTTTSAADSITVSNVVTPPPTSGGISSPLLTSTVNPRYFTDSTGAAKFLTGAWIWNTSYSNYNFSNYITWLGNEDMNFIRWYQQEEQTPYAYLSTGSPDTLPVDLTQFNPNYFSRLHSLALQAQQSGLYMSVMLFNGWSVITTGCNGDGDYWATNPYKSGNNVNGINGDPNNTGCGTAIHTLNNPTITSLEDGYAVHLVNAMNDLDNIIWEICNECDTSSTTFQQHYINLIRSTEAGLPNKHAVWFSVQWPNATNSVLFSSNADAIAPNDTSGNYLGESNGPNAATPPPIVIPDTDHLASPCSVSADWVWRLFTRGMGGIVQIDTDLTQTPIPADSSSACGPANQAQGQALVYARKMNLIAMTPQGSLSSSGYALANPGQEYLIYIPSGGSVNVNLSGNSNTFTVEWLNTGSGAVTSGGTVSGGGTVALGAPFGGPAVLYLLKQ